MTVVGESVPDGVLIGNETNTFDLDESSSQKTRLLGMFTLMEFTFMERFAMTVNGQQLGNVNKALILSRKMEALANS